MTISPFDALLSMSTEFDLFLDVHTWPGLVFEKKLTPPVILSDGVPVWGFSLMRQARDIGIPELPCRDISPKAKKELLFTALALENRSGTYTWMERLKIDTFCRQNNIGITDELIAAIEAKPFHDWALKVGQFAGFPGALQKLVQEKMLDLKTADRIKGLPERCFSMLYEKQNKLTHSERRMFLDQLFAVMIRDAMTVGDITGLCEQLLSEVDPMKQLEQIRFPKLTAMQNEFFHYSQTLRKKGITLTAPLHFEGEAFTIQIPFVSRSNFRKKLAVLQDFENQIDGLFTLL